MRAIIKGEVPRIKSGKREVVFKNWRRAIPFLKDRTGHYCHLCEMRVTNALAIEHILPKEHFPSKSGDWDNFLLICNYCNSAKLDQIPHNYQTEYAWPHLDNTHILFDYPLSSLCKPIPNPNAIDNEKARVANTISIYKLLEEKKSSGEADARFRERLQTLKMAIDRKIEYGQGKATIQGIVELAISRGFFSVWMKIFDDLPEVKLALINHADFHLQGKGFFDDQGNPIPRA